MVYERFVLSMHMLSSHFGNLALLNMDTQHCNSEVRIKNAKLHNMDCLKEKLLYLLILVCKNTMQNKQLNTTVKT